MKHIFQFQIPSRFNYPPPPLHKVAIWTLAFLFIFYRQCVIYLQIAIELYNVINNISSVDIQLVLVHIHHCLLVQFNIQLQHSAIPSSRLTTRKIFAIQQSTLFCISNVNFDRCQLIINFNFINIDFNSTSTLISTSI